MNGIIEILDSDLNSLMKLNCLEVLTISTIQTTDDFVVRGFQINSLSENTLLVWDIKTKTNFKVPSQSRIPGTIKFSLTLNNKLICRIDLTTFEVWDMSKKSLLFIYDTMFTHRFIFLT